MSENRWRVYIPVYVEQIDGMVRADSRDQTLSLEVTAPTAADVVSVVNAHLARLAQEPTKPTR